MDACRDNFGIRLHLLRARHALWFLAAIFALYLVPGAFYWLHTKPDVAQCLWGDVTCSLTVATYLLVLISGLAFIAALKAAWYAFESYQTGQNALGTAREMLTLEQTKILGARPCDEQHPFSVDITILSNDVKTGSPSDAEKRNYYEMGFEFMSLGRMPIVNARVPLACSLRRRSDEKSVSEEFGDLLSIGNFRADDDIHVRAWIENSILDLIVLQWQKNGAVCQVNKEQKWPLDFHPPEEQRPEFVGVLLYAQRVGPVATARPAKVMFKPSEPPTPPVPPASAGAGSTQTSEKPS